MIQFDVKRLTIEYLCNTSIGESIKAAISSIEKIENIVIHLMDKTNNESMLKVQIGTTLVIALLQKLYEKGQVKALTEEDWKMIANAVIDHAILTDETSYSMFVFQLYAKSIEAIASDLECKNSSVEKVDCLRSLGSELVNKSQELKSEKISETEYIENCLWICLEASIKIVSAYIDIVVDEELSHFVDAVTTFSFEYGRYTLYRKEQELLREYVENQYILDEALNNKLESLKSEMKVVSDRFINLIEHAFDSDFRMRLLGSVELARIVGVREEEILSSVEEIDAFFLD